MIRCQPSRTVTAHTLWGYIRVIGPAACIIGVGLIAMGNYQRMKPFLIEEEEDRTSLFYTRDTSKYHNILDMVAPTFLPTFKNPCWLEEMSHTSPYTDNPYYYSDRKGPGLREVEVDWERDKKAGVASRLRCLPYFYVVGFPQCGTADLNNKITYHAEVVRPTNTELHWWTRNRVRNIDRPEVVKMPLNMYVDFFDASARAISKRAEELKAEAGERAFTNIIVGDASPSTAWLYYYWGALPENAGRQTPQYTAAHYIHHVTPDAHIIFMVREPASRLYSSYMQSRYKTSPARFHEDVVQSISVWQDCMAWADPSDPYRQCVYNKTLRDLAQVNELWVGLYHVYVREWLEVFPQHQVRVFRVEDYAKNRYATLSLAYEFLGIRTMPLRQIQPFDRTISVNSRKHATREPMLSKTRKLLKQFYSPHNRELAILLDDDEFAYP